MKVWKMDLYPKTMTVHTNDICTRLWHKIVACFLFMQSMQSKPGSFCEIAAAAMGIFKSLRYVQHCVEDRDSKLPDTGYFRTGVSV